MEDVKHGQVDDEKYMIIIVKCQQRALFSNKNKSNKIE